MKLNKRYILTGLAAGGIALWGAVAATSISYAATTNSTNPIFDRVAQILGIQNTKLEDAVKQASTEQVDQMLKDGKITQAQADKIKERVANGDIKEFGMVGPGMKRGIKMGGFEDATTFLGMTKADLKTALQNGQKLSDIVTSKGKTVAEFKTYLTQKETDRINQDVKDGKLTQSQADKILSDLSTRLDNFINGTMPKFHNRLTDNANEPAPDMMQN